MFCPNCGSNIPDDSVFCSNCGKRISDQDISSEQKTFDEEKESEPKKKTTVNGKSGDKADGEERHDSEKKKWIIVATIVGIFLIGTVLYKIYPMLGTGGISDEQRTKQNQSITTSAENIASSETGQSEKNTSGSTEASITGENSTAASEVDVANITAFVTDAEPEDLNQCSKVQNVTATATSHLIQSDPQYNNEAKMAIDNDPVTSWQEGIDGDGVGQQMQLIFSAARIKYIDFKLGNWRRTDLYEKNARPASMTIALGGQTYQLEFSDAQIDHYVEFSSPIPAKDLVLTIQSVYSAVNADCCISEITLLS